MASSGWNLKHISYSMLSTWLTCREKFRQKYVLRNKEPDGIYFPQGNTIHAALYDFHQTPGLDEQLLYDMAQDYWANEIEGKEFYDFKGNRLTAEQVEEARIDTMRWLGGYVASVKAGDTPFISFATPPEQDVECNVDGSGFTLRGYIDFFPKDVTVMDTGETLMDCKDGYMHIGDFKTGSKKFNAEPNQSRHRPSTNRVRLHHGQEARSIPLHGHRKDGNPREAVNQVHHHVP